MGTFCGADCSKCGYVDKCPGCEATLGSPFGGCCVAAECVKAHGAEAYRSFKQALLEEINALLASEGFPPAERLYELNGAYVNLEYPLPCGGVKLLDDKAVYLGAQIECPCRDSCCGVVAGAGFIIICTYRGNGTDPELVLYKKR